ncbi:3'(2'),5'-bisphosphate nucleotidase CysQ [Chelatococcus sp. SYSU_G07232]|uniref:3'(2'),5'-bisphosphate nucleotidase CysQ n=1 Tax=Chelatococcus albus TaxID=3047466 RepID=A0ABT7AFI9_9HYPH|nr:3'(2'),5'-bisphosphate nucleotidase CysQ [Chelatococcus sp. SYSU_G07232]MDJ1158143.1 3'(2'),5'-bisphosphate nucleotidase CysQ [Chelatococcus sp. SYSU_G07232]
MSLDLEARDDVALLLGTIARRAGAAILDAFERGLATRGKADGSLCSDADLAAEECILAALDRAFPGLPVIAEERTAAGGATDVADVFFLVDPLDGTSDFIAGTGEYTVNIAAVSGGRPIAGAIYSPQMEHLWIAGRRAMTAAARPGDAAAGLGPWRDLAVRPAPREGLVALASRRHGDAATEAFLARLPRHERRAASSSLKFCLIAAGEADVYPRFGTTMEWDTAAGEAILTAAGGIVTDPSGAPLVYGRTDSRFANGPFIAWGDKTFAARMTQAA